MAKKKAIAKQDNQISEGRRDWTILMSRAYCRIVDIFNERVNAWVARWPLEEIKPTEVKYSDLFGKIPLSELLRYDIPRSDLAVVGKDGNIDIPTVKEFKKAFDRLCDNAIVIGSVDDEENWERINIIGSVSYNKEKDAVEVRQHERIVDYLLGLKDKYTAFNPWIAMKFQKSQYTFGFYEWCCQWRRKGTFNLTVRDIKHRFELDEHRDSHGVLHKEQYKLMKDFIGRVIEPARQELQELFDAGDCDVCFEYDKVYDKSKPGRPTVTGFDFVVVKKENKQLPPPKPQPMQESLFTDARSRLDQMRSTLMYYWSRSYDKEWPKRAIQELGWKVTADAKLLDKVELFIKDTIHDAQKGKVQNVPGAIHEYFKKQLGIVVDKKTKTKGSRV